MSQPSPAWRAVYFVQKLITWFAPPLHSLHWKIFALLFAGFFLPSIYFLWQVRLGIERSHLYSTEEGMIDTAGVLADALQSPNALSNLPRLREIKRRVFKDLTPNLRVVIYDAAGAVVFDSEGQIPAGTSAAQESDVRKALQGRYGSRWRHDRESDLVILYSTLPIFHGQDVTGAISVIKTTTDIQRSTLRSWKSLAIPAALAFGIAMLSAYLLSTYITRVVTDLAKRAERIAAGEEGVRLETWTKSELGDLARAVEAMRRKLEGKAYVEEMASTLSHELKTPLASIRGAAEIVEESDSPSVRTKFIANIRAETDRLTEIINNLLALSRIETRTGEETATSHMATVARETIGTYISRAEPLGLCFESEIAESDEPVAIPPELLRRVLEILLDNAFAFTPGGKTVRLETTPHSAVIRDEGCGIEPDVQGRIFERFFTTINPLTGRRGTGLGLAIARSIVLRCHGELSLQSKPGEGTTVTLRFPKIS